MCTRGLGRWVWHITGSTRRPDLAEAGPRYESTSLDSQTAVLRWAMELVNYPIGSMYGIYANIWGILMVNVTIYSIHGSYGYSY